MKTPHTLVGTDHTASGLTVGHVLRATGAASFAFGALQQADLPTLLANTTFGTNTVAGSVTCNGPSASGKGFYWQDAGTRTGAFYSYSNNFYFDMNGLFGVRTSNTTFTKFSVSSTGQLCERNRTTPIGEWTSVGFSSNNFTGSGSMTWTVEAGDVATYKFMEIGKTIFIDFYCTGTVIGGTANTYVAVKIPNSRVAATHGRVSGRMMGATTPMVADVVWAAGGKWINIYRNNGDNYPAQSNLYIAFQAIIEFQ